MLSKRVAQDWGLVRRRLFQQALERVGEEVHQERGLVGRVADLVGMFDAASQGIDGLSRPPREADARGRTCPPQAR